MHVYFFFIFYKKCIFKMPLTYLTQEEKLRSLIYISNHELSSDVNVQNKQYEILRVFWDNYIKKSGKAEERGSKYMITR